MLAKLSFRNAKRQAHDYIIYFVTLTAIFSLIHGLNSLLFAEDDIFPLDDSTFILPMILISSLLFSISLWLTSYMTNFILKLPKQRNFHLHYTWNGAVPNIQSIYP